MRPEEYLLIIVRRWWLVVLAALAAAAVGFGVTASQPRTYQASTNLMAIALPPDWANYGEIMSTFTSKYGITITNAAPTDSSAQENAAIVSLKGQSKAPDVVDVTPSVAVAGMGQNLYTPYFVTEWSSIPAYMKDSHGYWYGDYYGVQSIGSNLRAVRNPPQDWSDLTKSEYHNQVAIDGDPRTAGDAFGAVWGAALANGGSLDDITPGIDFFGHLKKIGNFIPADALPASIAHGATPIAIIWDYLNIANKQAFNGNPNYEVVIPVSGVFGNFYCQAVSASAPQPSAARLWEEFIYSDQGQLLYLKGFTHPARYVDMANRGVIPASMAAALPPASAYAKAQFPNLQQTLNAAKVVASQWGPKVVSA